ncbi:MAG: 3',5'-cyclic-nucleotide phosphodiesterase [Candidatus Edwardsbacteria bacterium]|nr:3',5'-cyclic-nucleotide phosphodiesterase [Candidatus Edwardsbacteria bacterium]
MKIRVLGSSGSQLPGLNLTSFLLDKTVLIDAGSAASMLDLDEQKKIELVLLSHIHIDHSLGLMLMADNLVGQTKKPIRILSIPEVLDGLRGHLFNNQVWPDFTSIPSAKSAVFNLQALRECNPVKAGKYTVTAVKVSHAVPTAGFIVSDDRSSLLYTGDTRSTERIWKQAQKAKNLKGVIIETSFPNQLQSLADVSGHLTPRSLLVEINKSKLSVPFYIYHLKALYLGQVQKEIAALKNPQIRFATEGATYTF